MIPKVEEFIRVLFQVVEFPLIRPVMRTLIGAKAEIKGFGGADAGGETASDGGGLVETLR